MVLNTVRKITGAAERVSLQDDPKYVAAARKLEELKGHAEQLDRQREDLLNGLATEQYRDELTGRAEKLLAAGDLDDSQEIAHERMRTDLTRIYDELRVVRRAVDLQAQVVGAERMRVSKVITDRVRPEHRRIVKRLAAALEALSDAVAEERQFRERLHDADVSLGDLRPMPFNPARLDEEYSPASLWMKDARDNGLV